MKCPIKCKEIIVNFMINHNLLLILYYINDNSIERVLEYKLLGVYISNDLRWTHHVDYMIQAVWRATSFISRCSFCSIINIQYLLPHFTL